jgi:hypothetical protein
MRRDIIFEYLEKDDLILYFGKILIRKLGSKRKNDVAQRMRQLGRLKYICQNTTPETQFLYYIAPDHWEDVLQGIEELAGLEESNGGLPIFQTPSRASRLGNHLVKRGEMKLGLAIRTKNAEMKEEAESFLKLHKAEFTDRISSIALTSLNVLSFNKTNLLPLTSDLIKLKVFLDDTCEVELKRLQTDPNEKVWRRVCNLLCARITVFNKRRGNEVSNLLVETYNQKANCP